jgi:hypothetical protein
MEVELVEVLVGGRVSTNILSRNYPLSPFMIGGSRKNDYMEPKFFVFCFLGQMAFKREEMSVQEKRR